MKVLITAGGTRVPIDSVRHIGNMSSGEYGCLLAREFMNVGNNVTLFIDKHSPCLKSDVGQIVHECITYRDYFDYLKVKDLIKNNHYDVIISAAAVSDYITDKIDGKISSDNEEFVIKLRKGEKVIQSFRELSPNSMIVGFKLLSDPTDEVKQEAIEKQLKYVDYVVYNDLAKIKQGDGTRYIYDKHKTETRGISPRLIAKFIRDEWKIRIN